MFWSFILCLVFGLWNEILFISGLFGAVEKRFNSHAFHACIFTGPNPVGVTIFVAFCLGAKKVIGELYPISAYNELQTMVDNATPRTCWVAPKQPARGYWEFSSVG